MILFLRNISFLLLFSLSFLFANAQNITGTWEGRMGTEKLQINIDQKGSKICGYTHDYVVANPESFCKAKFEGYLDGETNTWYLRGVQFFENSGEHVLMRLALWRNRGDGRDELRVAVTTGSLLSGGMFGDRDEVILKRVSTTPNNLPAYLPPCFPKKEKKPALTPKPETPKPVIPKPVTPKPVTPKPVTPKPVTPKPVTPKTDTIKKPAPVLPKQDPTPIVKRMIQRRQSEQSRIAISSNHLNIKVYDNGEIDNDTVSIFYNKKLLISHKRLSDKPIELDIDLDPGVSTHEITLFAENLGGIPPNTALVVVKAGNKRYELRSKASLQENAVLVFEYKPGGPE